MSLRHSIQRTACGAALVLLAACTDQGVLPTTPQTPPPSALGQVTCSVDVRAGTMSCSSMTSVAATSGARGDRIIGKQDVYVKISSSGTAWDEGTEILSSNVVVQNLADRAMGTPDGTTVGGVKIFFASGPTVTAGSGEVTLANADGTDLFLASNQPYFNYPEILAPYQISQARSWQFNVPGDVLSFQFTVYVSAALPDESAALADKVWTGAVSSDWSNPANWQGGAAPVETSVVAIPPDSLLGAGHHQPVLGDAAAVAYLRVGYGSSLDLAGHTLTVSDNVDAVGTITGGAVLNTGSGTLLRGNVNALQVSGSARLQGGVKASSSVAVSGTLTATDQVLTVRVP
jgi:hypothetical protein